MNCSFCRIIRIVFNNFKNEVLNLLVDVGVFVMDVYSFNVIDNMRDHDFSQLLVFYLKELHK